MARSRWKETELLIQEAREILMRENPMTIRQLFYRLVSIQALQNNRSDYQRLSRIMTDARKDYEVDFDWIVDRSKTEYIPNVWDDASGYLKTVAKSYRKDRWRDQTYYIEIWSEKDTLYGVLEPILDKYGVVFRAHRGFSSTTKKHELAELFQAIDKPIVIFYLGDFDPSGMEIPRDLIEQLEEYGAYGFELKIIAILRSDIKDFNLPPLRVKDKDSRAKGFKSKYGSEAVEVDALPPVALRDRVESLIWSLIDIEPWQRAEEVEKVEFESIKEIAGKFKELVSGG